MCCVARGHLIERFCVRVTPIILSSYLLRSWGFCSFSSLPLAVPRFTPSGFDSVRRRDLIPSSKSKSSATSTECFSCSLKKFAELV
ncbi:hypothetical protein glysoja_036231 [Glycine soja]|uniref:Uncharacterized protein n=1 Tax=Glycine soja TaxID=3848 RepID=A0A0B2QCV2_GLYSO|nr:hypothetical protein glysoja_036231 [Glycine soja]